MSLVKAKVVVSGQQNRFLDKYPEIAFEIYDYLVDNMISDQAVAFSKQLLQQMVLNPGLYLDIEASSKSPMNIDRSKINSNTPEGKKFNEIYDDALVKSPEFQKLFIDIFKDGTRSNVKFEIDDHVHEDNDTTKKEVNAITILDPVTKIIIIKISKQILIAGTTKSQTKIENAKTILHECIHAYLFIKAKNPSIGADFVKILNSMYPNTKEQHDFMYGKMIPTMQKILGEIRDLITTTPKRVILENDVIIHPTPSTSKSWNWNDYYFNLSLNGLDQTSCFIEDHPNNSNALSLFNQYISHGHNELDK